MRRTISYREKQYVNVQLLNVREFPIHNHPDFQIYYVLEGELMLTLFYSKYKLEPGSIHIIHSQDVHSIQSITEDNLVLVISLDSDYFQNVFPHFITTVFITNIEAHAFEKVDVLRDRIFAIVAEEYEQAPGFEGRINNHAVSLINTLMNHFRGFVISPHERSFIHQTSHDYMQVERISRIIQYVYENYPYKLSLTDLAEKEQMSPYYLSHIFHKLVGLNFRDFVSMVRIEMSESAVLSTDRSITQIARDVGFSAAKYYVRHFFDFLGYHPKEYRRVFQKEILGTKPPSYEEHPLSALRPIVNRHTQFPVFPENISDTALIEIDFCTQTQQKLPLLRIGGFGLQDIYTDIPGKMLSEEDIALYYKDVNPQESVINMLCDLLRNPSSFSLPEISLFDSTRHTNGLLTVNGLKKPLYYILQLMEQFPQWILTSGPHYIVLKGDKNACLLVFNPGQTYDLTVDIVTRHVPSSAKLTKYHLRAANSCLNFWAQLNFSSQLTREDVMNINLMSHPDISFEIVPARDQYYTTLELAPGDIQVLMFHWIQ